MESFKNLGCFFKFSKFSNGYMFEHPFSVIMTASKRVISFLKKLLNVVCYAASTSNAYKCVRAVLNRLFKVGNIFYYVI